MYSKYMHSYFCKFKTNRFTKAQLSFIRLSWTLKIFPPLKINTRDSTQFEINFKQIIRFDFTSELVYHFFMAQSFLILYEPLDSLVEKREYWNNYITFYEKYWGGPTS